MLRYVAIRYGATKLHLTLDRIKPIAYGRCHQFTVLLETDTQKFDRYSFVDRRQDPARGFLFVYLFVFKFARDGRVRPSEEP